jgi:hypothetical protein
VESAQPDAVGAEAVGDEGAVGLADKNMRSAVLSLLFGSQLAGTSIVAQPCTCSAQLIPFYAKTTVRVSLEAIKDTTDDLDYVGVSIADSVPYFVSRMEPTSYPVVNARSYYSIKCPDRVHEVVLDRSGRIDVDGTMYLYEPGLVRYLACVIPSEDRWRYVPSTDDRNFER